MTRTGACLAVMMIAACSPEPSLTNPEPPSRGANASNASAPGSRALVIYSQNVYVGTDVDAVLTAPPELLQQRVFEALGTFAATNWPERAARIADQIIAAEPHLVSLNEVSTVTVSGLAPLFPDVEVQFLPILLSALAERGGGYHVAGIVANIDAALTLGGAQIRLEDFDVVLARNDVAVTNVQAHRYAAGATVPLGALGTIDLVRGWVQVDAGIDGRTVRFVSTHLEPQETSLPLQLAQSGELIAALDGAPHPVVIAGDLNSDPRAVDPVTSYLQFGAAGFHDAWLARTGSGSGAGFTCCTTADLGTSVPGHHKRIDLILVRPVGHPRGQGIGPVRFDIFGDSPLDRTTGGLWPSDHAGVVASIPWRQLDGVPGR